MKWLLGESRSSIAFKVVIILVCFVLAGSLEAM